MDAWEPQALIHYIYVDNIIGLDPGFVGSAQAELVSRFNMAVLRAHEEESHKSSAVLLGVHVDLKEHQTQITNSRYCRDRLGLKALLRLGSCICKCVEVIIEHCTFLALVQRVALATFHDVYTFMHKIYHTRAKMWPSVRWELKHFLWSLALVTFGSARSIFLRGTRQ